MKKHSSINSARIISVIEIQSDKGEGGPGDPVRRYAEYWSLQGELLAVNDPYFCGEIPRASSKASSDSM